MQNATIKKIGSADAVVPTLEPVVPQVRRAAVFHVLCISRHPGHSAPYASLTHNTCFSVVPQAAHYHLLSSACCQHVAVVDDP
jgi:hypothetical protein